MGRWNSQRYSGLGESRYLRFRDLPRPEGASLLSGPPAIRHAGAGVAVEGEGNAPSQHIVTCTHTQKPELLSACPPQPLALCNWAPATTDHSAAVSGLAPGWGGRSAGWPLPS